MVESYPRPLKAENINIKKASVKYDGSKDCKNGKTESKSTIDSATTRVKKSVQRKAVKTIAEAVAKGATQAIGWYITVERFPFAKKEVKGNRFKRR